MAGSYKHVVGSDLEFRGTELLDTLCDAYEALEELHLMIMYLTGGNKEKIHEAWTEGYLKTKCPTENHTLEMNSFKEFWSEDDQ